MGARLDSLVTIVIVCFVFVCGNYSVEEDTSSSNVSTIENVNENSDYVIDVEDEVGNHSVSVADSNSSLSLIEVKVNVTDSEDMVNVSDSEDKENVSDSDLLDGEAESLNASKLYVSEGNDTDDGNSTVKSEKDNCTVCEVREGDRQYRIESIKKQILETLNFQKPPNMTGRTLPKVPRLSFLLERSQFQSDSPRYRYHDYDEYPYDHNEHLFTIAKTPPPDLPMNESHISFFNLPAEMRGAKVKKAVLWYYTKKTKPQKTVIKVHIHKLKPTDDEDNPVVRVPLKYKKIFPQRVNTWHHLDIRNVVQDWVDRPHMNYGLQLVALDHNKDNLIVNPPTSADDAGYEPMIELKTVRRHHRRVRRTPLMCNANSTERRCCRYPLRVNFVNFGWDWVIYPHDYRADYCSGECRFSMMDANHHATMQQHASSTGPCCTPTALSPISMLYFDHDHNVIITNLQDMKVESCGCS